MASPVSSGAFTADHFALAGPSRRLDPRINAYRPDVADIGLAGVWFAPHYARPLLGQIGVSSVMLRAAPHVDARAVSQLMLGEEFETLDISGGWRWGRSVHDRYVGYLPEDTLTTPRPVTHRILSIAAPVFAEADVKAPVLEMLPIAARIEATVEREWFKTAQGYIHPRHAAPIDSVEDDPVAIASRLIGQPYLWGGRGAGGVDCSGLVQIALAFAGHDCARDTDLQRDSIGRALAEDEPLARGDLVYFPGHVGMMIDGDRMLHANAFWMSTVIEPLADVVERLISAHPSPIVARRRLETGK